MTPAAFEGNEPQRDGRFTRAATGADPLPPRLKQASPSVQADEKARATAAVDQETGVAREYGRLAAAFFLEAIRAGMPQGEAVAITGDYIRSTMQDRAIRDSVRERTERGPLDI